MENTRYLLVNANVNVSGRWFLRFQQYEILDEVMLSMVEHHTNTGAQFISQFAVSNHFVLKVGDDEVIVPDQIGVVVDFKIPEEWADRVNLVYESMTDGITDYIKAAKEYLNIEVRFRPESSHWYRKLYPKYVPSEDQQVGDNQTERTRNANISKDSL